MKSTKQLAGVALLALAAGIAGTLSSSAAVVADPENGDIFLGFRAEGGTGGATSYLINLGQSTQFQNAAPGATIELSLGNIAADLAATYGSGWADRADLHWGIFGVRNSSSPLLYSSQGRSDVETQGPGWNALDLASRTGTASQISSVIEQIGGFRGQQTTPNTLTGVFQANTSAASSYAKQVATAGTTDFGSLSQWGSIEGNFGTGTEGTVLDFYRFSGSSTSPVSYLGNFSITDSGTISFTAVPEPSAALLGGLGTFLLLGRRRRAAAL